jgi:hypothetical protein
MKIEANAKNLKIKSAVRKITMPQMVTWMLYAAAVHDDFSKYVRYPFVDLRTLEYITPVKEERRISSVRDTDASESSSSSSSSSSASSSSSF